MSTSAAIENLRKKIAYSRGLRKVRAEAELVEHLVTFDNAEAILLGRSTLERARTLAENATERGSSERPYREALAHALRSMAYADKSIRRFREAGELLRESILLYEELREGVELVRCWQLMHLVQRDQSNYPQALHALDTALEIARQTGFHSEDSVIMGERGMILSLMNEPEQAGRAFEEALGEAERQSDIRMCIIILANFAHHCLIMHQADRADRMYREALRLQEEHQALGGANFLIMLWNYVRILRDFGRYPAALHFIDRCIALAEHATLYRDCGLLLLLKVQMLFSCCEYADTLALLHSIHARPELQKEPSVSAKSWALLARVYDVIGDVQAREDAARQTLSLIADIQPANFHERVEILSAIFALLASGTRAVDAQQFIPAFIAARAYSEEARDKSRTSGISLGLGLLYEYSGERDRAIGEIRRAVDSCRGLSRHGALGDALFYLGRALCNQAKELREACVYLEEALELALKFGELHLQVRIHQQLSRCYELLGESEAALAHDRVFRGLKHELVARFKVFPVQQQKEDIRDLRQHKEYRQTLNALAELRSELSALQRMLQSKDSHIGHLRDTLARIHSELNRQERESTSAYNVRLATLRNNIDVTLADDSWRTFEREVREQDDEFLLRLGRDYPKLTATERKICALIRLNNTSKDLARLLNIAPRSVQAYRYRIRKKLGLSAEDDLNTCIAGI